MLFKVLPNVDNLSGLFIMNGVCFIPALLRLIFSSRRGQTELKKMFIIVLDLLAILFQGSIWFIFMARGSFNTNVISHTDKRFILHLILSTFLISLGWWENFAQVRFTSNRISFFIQTQIMSLRKHNAKIYMVANCLKIVAIFLFSYSLMPIHLSDDLEHFSQQLNFTNNDNMIHLANLNLENKEIVRADLFYDNFNVYYPMIIHMISTAICFYIGRVACKLLMQGVGYSLPVSLTTPVTFLLMLLLSYLSGFESHIAMSNGDLGNFLYLEGIDLSTCLITVLIGLLVYWISQMWIASHIWFPKLERMAKNERIFCVPYYESALIDQSLMMNRHRLDEILPDAG
jgi:chitin synthase